MNNTPVVLQRLIAEASVLGGGEHPCSILGHKWKHIGGSHCGCENGSCSVPVHECESCGDVDYGENEEASDIRNQCDREKRDIFDGIL